MRATDLGDDPRDAAAPGRRRFPWRAAVAWCATAGWAAACASAGGASGAGGPVEAPGTAAAAEEPAGRAENAGGDAAAPSPVAAIYSAPQADRGRSAFEEQCSECHATGEFRGTAFQANWGRRTVYSLYRTMRSTMPDNNPGGLDEQVYLDVVAYVLEMNGHAAGPSELDADSPMRDVRIALPAPGS